MVTAMFSNLEPIVSINLFKSKHLFRHMLALSYCQRSHQYAPSTGRHCFHLQEKGKVRKSEFFSYICIYVHLVILLLFNGH